MQLNLLNNYRASKSFLCVSVLNAFACGVLQFAFSIINHVPAITNVNSKTICCVCMAFAGEALHRATEHRSTCEWRAIIRAIETCHTMQGDVTWPCVDAI